MRRSLVVVALTTALTYAGVAAFASWNQSVDGTAAARAQSLAGNKPAGTVSGSNVTVTWTAGTFSDGTAATGYTVRRYSSPGGTVQTVGANCAGTITGTTCTENGVPAGTWQYTVTPSYLTWTGSESTKSDAVVVVAVVVDTSKPTTTATPSPTPNAAGWNSADVTVTLAATDNVAVKQVTYSATGAQSFGSTTVIGSSATTPAITAAGTTTLSYFAEDVAGNVEATKTLTIKLDKTAPAASLTTLPARIRNGQSLAGTYADGGSGIASVTYYSCPSTETCTTANGTSIGSSSISPYSVTWNSQPADGDYKVVANAVDAAGNATLAAFVTTTVDNTAPTITALSIPNNGTTGKPERNDTIVITFSENPDLTSMCAGWTGSTFGTTNNNDIEVAITDGGSSAPDVLTVTSTTSCGGSFNLGSIALGAAGSATGYVTGGTARFKDQTKDFPSKISWDAANKRLTVTLGTEASGGGGVTVASGAASRATYTPSTSIKDLAGNQLGGTASSPAAAGSTTQQF